MLRLRAGLGLSVQRAARLGHLATGVTYVAVGIVAFLAALDRRSYAMSSQGALRYVFGGELGSIGILAVAVGLAADFIWQIVRSVTNADEAPPGVKGIADRVGWTIGGVIHLGLAVSAVKLALNVPQPTADRQAQVTSAVVMADPVGRFGLVVAGMVIVLVALQLFYRAYTGDLDRWLELQSLHPLHRTTVLALGRFGLAARGAVFCVGGAILIDAAIQNRPSRVRALGGTLQAIGESRLGPPLLVIVALGFVAFGVVELLSASYRRINVQ
jgi:uncharacterized protein DUF1206